ncbi:LrgB family protein [Heyndrickxia ginsengihumi]|uniref:LrgB family protein n=1 Tax=Heyndrickxia ginsengihumi TaxID=363870 RepID=UPI000AB0A7CE
MAIILILLVSHISYQNYQIAKDIMSYFLGPATVALAIPLYKNRTMMLKYLTPILFGMIVGSTVTISSAVILAKLLHLSQHVLAALTIKSITVPVASEVAKNIGANQVLVAGFVMITGMFGAMFGLKLLSLLNIHHPISRGLALGTISHGIGTGEAVKEGEIQGAISGVAMAFTAVLTSFIIPWFFR